jgi:hypothetical protein
MYRPSSLWAGHVAIAAAAPGPGGGTGDGIGGRGD